MPDFESSGLLNSQDSDNSGLIIASTVAKEHSPDRLTSQYCIITAVRDEEAFIGATIECVAAQTIRPAEWIIVNDGSTDQTGIIIDQYAKRYSWIQPIHRENRGFRSTGGGIEGFLLGTESLKSRDWEFLVNLDGDLTFALDYFEKCFEHFRRLPRLGIGGGTIYNEIGENLQVERTPLYHVRGATKIYSRRCWEDIGGLVPGLGWDTVDEVKANMRGWTTQSFLDLQLIHHRVTGTAEGQWWGLVKDGHADYIVGYHPLFFAAKCMRRLFKPPFVLGAIGLSYGFLRSCVQRKPRVGDKEFVRYLRSQQLRRLFGLETIWK
jgi:hypothetical protein